MRQSELEALYKRYLKTVYNYMYYRLLNRAQAEDLTSAVFVKVVSGYHTFDPSKAAVSTWIMRIAHNTLVDHYRTNKADVPLDQLEGHEPFSEEEYPELDDRAQKLRTLLSRLPGEDREIVFLKYFEEKKNVEIADILGMKPPTVATRLRRALQTMRGHAKEMGL